MDGIFSSWGRILGGYAPSLSIEITRECPLRCPGCYAYGDEHLGGVTTLREVRDFKGQALINGVHALVDRHKPLHVSIVGGEPLVRYRELNELLPQLSARGLHVQVVTSAVRRSRRSGRRFRGCRSSSPSTACPPSTTCAARRPPTTASSSTSSGTDRRALHGDAAAGAAQRVPRGVRAVLAGPAALPQDLVQPLHAADRRGVGREASSRGPARGRRDAARAARAYPKIEMPKGMIEVYAKPPASPEECIFARVTKSFSADLETRITPCQFGGRPDCENCGCIASAGLGAIGRYRLAGPLRVDHVFNASFAIGAAVRSVRERLCVRRRGAAAGRLPSGAL